MARVLVDRAKCAGSGMCTSIAPAIFELDDKGELVILKDDVAVGELAAVQDAVACCPVEALVLEDGR